MASFIPSVYHPVDLGIGDIGNILLQARKQSRDDEARRAELLMRQEAADRENARLDEQMRRTSELENHQRQVDVANTLPKIKAMLTPGDPSYDPETGMSLARAYGINLSAQQPQMPTAPQRPESAPSLPDGDGLDAVSGANEKSPATAVANSVGDDRFAGQMADYQRQLAHPRAPTYSGTSPVGPISIDPNAAVAAREERLRQQREQMAPLTGGVDEQFKPVILGMINAGMPASEIAKAISERQKQVASDQEKSTYHLTAAEQARHNRAMEAAAMLNAGRMDRGDADKRRDKEDETTVRDENGVPIGHVPTGRGGAQGFATRDADYGRGEQMLQSLLDDIEKNGPRVATPEAAQRRATLHKNAIIGVATVSPLGKTDEAQKLEAASIGPSGAPDMHDKTGLLIGANPEAIRRKLDELRAQRQRYRSQTLIPLSERPAPTPRRQSTQNERRADTLRNAGKSGPTMDDLMKFEKEHGL